MIPLNATSIPDVQNMIDTRHLAINKVGIKSIRHPVQVKDKNEGVQHTSLHSICMCICPIISRVRICHVLLRY